MLIVALSAGQELNVLPISMKEIDMGQCIEVSYSIRNQTIHVYRASWTSHENRVLSEGERVRKEQVIKYYIHKDWKYW